MSQENSTDHELGPGLGLFTATMIVMGTIIGSGVFKKIAPMTLKLQSESLVLWCWVIAGLITLFGALTYAELASRLAQTGGQYAYLRSVYGRFTGFLFGWASFSVIQSASIASIAYVFAEAFVGLLPESGVSSLRLVGGVQFVAISTIVFLTAVNHRGLFFGALLENVFTVLKVLGIFVVIALGFYFTKSQNAAPQIPISPVSRNLSGLGMMFAAMMGAFWAFDGINNIGFIGGEIRNPKRNVPLALIVGVLGVIAIYLAINIAFFNAVSVPEILDIAKIPHKIFAVEMVNKVAGSQWSVFVAIVILISTFGCTNGSILSSSRIYFAMAVDGVFFRSLGLTHTKYKTPHRALWWQAAWASLLILSGTFDELTDLLVFAAFLFYGLGAFGLFLLRARKVGNPRFQVPSIIPILYILFCVSLVLVNLFENPKSSLIGLGLILSGVPIYFYLQRKNQGKALVP